MTFGSSLMKTIILQYWEWIFRTTSNCSFTNRMHTRWLKSFCTFSLVINRLDKSWPLVNLLSINYNAYININGTRYLSTKNKGDESWINSEALMKSVQKIGSLVSIITEFKVNFCCLTPSLQSNLLRYLKIDHDTSVSATKIRVVRKDVLFFLYSGAVLSVCLMSRRY
jgi:hypothetical protein